MALVLDFNIVQEEDGSFYTITDLTGVYDVTTNPTGWGAPNLDIASVTIATVDVQLMDEDGNFASVLTAGEKDVLDLPNFPNDSDGDIEKTVVLEDGYYKAIYYVTDGVTTYTTTKYFTFYSSFKCCYKKIALAVGSCCDNQAKKLKLLEANVVLNALETAAAEQSPTTGGGLEVYKTIEYSEKVCQSCGCGC